jgi:DNA helicase HerA-like ATPase
MAPAKFVLPEAALHQNIAVLGKNGSGKTYAAKGSIVEPLLAQGRRVGIVDPTGAWWGLRSSSDGKGPGFSMLVLGGDHGDLPLPPNGGAAVARLLVEQGVNLVADTSQLTVGERTRWFTEFAGTLYRANKTPLHLILDEAHNFAPQGKVPDPDAGKMLHAAARSRAKAGPAGSGW